MLYTSCLVEDDRPLLNLCPNVVQSPVELTDSMVELTVLLREVKDSNFSKLDEVFSCFSSFGFCLNIDNAETYYSVKNIKQIETADEFAINKTIELFSGCIGTISFCEQIEYLYELVCNQITKTNSPLFLDDFIVIKELDIPTHVDLFFLLCAMENLYFSKQDQNLTKDEVVLNLLRSVEEYKKHNRGYVCSMLLKKGEVVFPKQAIISFNQIGFFNREIVKLALYTYIFDKEIGLMDNQAVFLRAIGRDQKELSVLNEKEENILSIKADSIHRIFQESENTAVNKALNMIKVVDKIFFSEVMNLLFNALKHWIETNGLLIENNTLNEAELKSIKENNQVFYDVMVQMERLIKDDVVSINNYLITEIISNYKC